MAAATALTIASLAATAATTTGSFIQASKQKKLQQKLLSLQFLKAAKVQLVLGLESLHVNLGQMFH